MPEICVGADYTAAAALKVGLQSGGSALAFIYFLRRDVNFPAQERKLRVVAAVLSNFFKCRVVCRSKLLNAMTTFPRYHLLLAMVCLLANGMSLSCSICGQASSCVCPSPQVERVAVVAWLVKMYWYDTHFGQSQRDISLLIQNVLVHFGQSQRGSS